MNERARTLTTQLDVASWMLAAADDSDGLVLAVADLTEDAARELLICALVVGGTLVSTGDAAEAAGVARTPRQILAALIETLHAEQGDT